MQVFCGVVVEYGRESIRSSRTDDFSILSIRYTFSGGIWMSRMWVSSGRRRVNVGSKASSCVKTYLEYEFNRLTLSVSLINSLLLVFNWCGAGPIAHTHYITLHYITLSAFRTPPTVLHLKWPVVHQQLHVIRNTAHRPSTQASYTASRVRPKRKISCAAAQIAATQIAHLFGSRFYEMLPGY